MLYQLHEMQRLSLKASFGIVASAMGYQSSLMRSFNAASLANTLAASAEIAHRIAKDYPKQPFGLDATQINGRKVAVTEEIISDKAFGSLLHFKRDTGRNDPKVLLVAPMSGHYATLLREMVRELLPHHDVYITDWKNPRDVPLSKGNFGLEDYIAYTQDFIEAMGPDTHVVGISQSTVPLLSAVALMAANQSTAQPASMTLMCGPIDTRISPTAIGQFAKRNPLSWFKDNVIARVPSMYAGHGRSVYPGFLQLIGLKATDAQRHARAMFDLFRHIAGGNEREADKIRKYYDEYDAMMDSADQFYLDTIHHVFQNHSLAKGELTWRGQKIDPSRITKTALLTVEGAKDTICGPGQTLAAHLLCSGLKDNRRFSHTQPNAGHYDILSSPRIAGFIRTIAQQNGITYDPVPQTDTIRPVRQDLGQAQRSIKCLKDGANDNTTQQQIDAPHPSAA